MALKGERHGDQAGGACWESGRAGAKKGEEGNVNKCPEESLRQLIEKKDKGRGGKRENCKYTRQSAFSLF